MIEDQAFLSRAAVATEARMRDSCSITAPATGGTTMDPDTWLPVGVAGGAEIYAGPCRLRMAGNVSGSSARDVAGDRVTISSPMLSVPLSAPRIPVGSVVVITGVPAGDPAGHLRLGLRLRVTGLVLGTDMSAQRVTVETVTG